MSYRNLSYLKQTYPTFTHPETRRYGWNELRPELPTRWGVLFLCGIADGTTLLNLYRERKHIEYHPDRIILSDISNSIVSVYEQVRDGFGSLELFLSKFGTVEEKIDFVRSKDSFYDMPQKEMAAWFLLSSYLTTSGLVTANPKGGDKIKLSIGKNRNFPPFNIENLERISQFLKNCSPVKHNYLGFDFITEAKETDLIIVDVSQPNEGRNKRILQFYYDHKDRLNHIQLARNINLAHSQGARIIILSNDFTPPELIVGLNKGFKSHKTTLPSFHFQTAKHTESTVAKSHKITKNY